jgi:hypothetical protein
MLQFSMLASRPLLISDPHETYQANIIACAAITFAIGTIFVALRFYTRGCLLHVLGAEDWCILASLVFSGANSAGMIEREPRLLSILLFFFLFFFFFGGWSYSNVPAEAVYGLGKHFLDIEPEKFIPLTRVRRPSAKPVLITSCSHTIIFLRQGGIRSYGT